MSHISHTPAGAYPCELGRSIEAAARENICDEEGGAAVLAEIESSMTRGLYVDPHAGRTLFADHATRWKRA